MEVERRQSTNIPHIQPRANPQQSGLAPCRQTSPSPSSVERVCIQTSKRGIRYVECVCPSLKQPLLSIILKTSPNQHETVYRKLHPEARATGQEVGRWATPAEYATIPTCVDNGYESHGSTRCACPSASTQTRQRSTIRPQDSDGDEDVQLGGDVKPGSLKKRARATHDAMWYIVAR